MTQAALCAEFLEPIEMSIDAYQRQLTEQEAGVKVKALPGVPIVLTLSETTALRCQLARHGLHGCVCEQTTCRCKMRVDVSVNTCSP